MSLRTRITTAAGKCVYVIAENMKALDEAIKNVRENRPQLGLLAKHGDHHGTIAAIDEERGTIRLSGMDDEVAWKDCEYA